MDKIKHPLFVVQGAKDPRVNIDEADQIVESLRKRGVDVPYMVKYDEGHGFGKEENRWGFCGELEIDLRPLAPPLKLWEHANAIGLETIKCLQYPFRTTHVEYMLFEMDILLMSIDENSYSTHT